MTHLIFQAHFKDHLSPLLAAFNEAMAWGGDAPPLPPEPVFIERHAFRGGGSIRLMPSSALLAWMAEVMEQHEVLHREREARDDARSKLAEGSSL